MPGAGTALAPRRLTVRHTSPSGLSSFAHLPDPRFGGHRPLGCRCAPASEGWRKVGESNSQDPTGACPVSSGVGLPHARTFRGGILEPLELGTAGVEPAP